MTLDIVKIKGISYKTIVIDNIRYYKDIFCKCKCDLRIPHKKSHERSNIEIPEYIKCHDKRPYTVEETVIKNGIKYYKDYVCKYCGEKILYPTDKRTLREHKRLGIPEYHSRGCNLKMYMGTHEHWKKGLTKETDIGVKIAAKKQRKTIRKNGGKFGETNSFYGKKHTKKTKDYLSKVAKKNYIEHPEYFINNRTLFESTGPELVIRDQLDKFEIEYLVNVHQIIGSPDIVISTNNGHPIIIFVDGCYWHGCLKCFPNDKISYKQFEHNIEKRHKDKVITKKLIKQGFIVIRIWEHDIENGNYRKIIKGVINAFS